VKKLSFKKKIILSASIFIIASLVLLGLSYRMLQMLIFSGDNIFYGTKQSVLAQEIREELFKLNDIQNVKFKASEGLTLSGILIRRPNAKANMVLCHGYRASKEFMYGFINLFPQFNLLLFDFRAHGQSEGKIISIGCHEYKDVLAATEFMKNSVKTDEDKKIPFIILGLSMGAASSIKAASLNPDLCDALIIDSTFSDLGKMIVKGFAVKSGLPYYPFFPVLRWLFEYLAECKIYEMSTVESVKKITKPILFIHSCNDNFISPKHGLRLYENASLSRYARIWIAPKCRHGWLNSYYSDIYKKKVYSFLRKSLNLKID
jgi:pimeloyl-ACP methyl ester carboxylesterase